MCRLLYIQLEVEAWVCINPHIKCVRFMTVLIIHSEPDPVCWSCSDGDTADWKGAGWREGERKWSLPCSCSLWGFATFVSLPRLPLSVCVCLHFRYSADCKEAACRRSVSFTKPCGNSLWADQTCGFSFMGLGPPCHLFSTCFLAPDPTSLSWLCPINVARWGETSRSYIRRPHWHDKFIIISISSELFTATTSSRRCSELASFIRC